MSNSKKQCVAQMSKFLMTLVSEIFEILKLIIKLKLGYYKCPVSFTLLLDLCSIGALAYTYGSKKLTSLGGGGVNFLKYTRKFLFVRQNLWKMSAFFDF
jgi:hypothetical protein